MPRDLSEDEIKNFNANLTWQNLRKDRELQPEIRDHAISIYYQNSALLRNFSVQNNTFSAKVHVKFVPTRRSSSDYQLLQSGESGELVFSENLGVVPFGTGEPDVVDQYKARIDALAGDEAILVQKINENPLNLVIDQEIVFAELVSDRDRLDMCYFDTELDAVAFAEVKQIADSRLYGDQPEVLTQLQRYRESIEREADNIKTDYARIVRIKRELGMEDRLKGVPESFSRVVRKPILVIGNCTRDDVVSIMNGQGIWKDLRAGIEKCASRLVLFGRTNGGRLALPNSRQSLTFDNSIV